MTHFIRTHLASLARLIAFTCILAAAVAGVTFHAALTTAETRALSTAHKSRHYGLPNAVIRESADCSQEANGTPLELCIGPLSGSIYFCPAVDAPCGADGWTVIVSGV